MRKFGKKALFLFDSKIKRTCRKNRKEKREASRLEQDTMADDQGNDLARGQEGAIINNRALRDYALPTVNETFSGIRRPTI